MTRYARAGKGSHQRVAKDSTTWNELKPPKPERVRGSDEGTEKTRNFSSQKRNKKERFSKGGRGNSGNAVSPSLTNNKSEETLSEGTNHQQRGGMRKWKDDNIRGFGQSKSVKIFGQFWVPFEDGKRLKGLLKKLKAQGMPRKQILDVLQNERRKAEKAAKRQRDKTCFQCRQFGHILSDCPNLKETVAEGMLESGGDDGAMEGTSEQGLICYKCGSTEHSSRNCKRKGEKFKFAKCFICSGTGHIARQCPKNTNGIYPSGGSCSECGSTAHLKKDCPDLMGIEQNFSSKDETDTDAVTLRIADPYSSTEYEPVFAQENEESDNDQTTSADDKVEDETSNATESKETRSKPNISNKKGKRKMDKRDSESVAEFNFGNNDDVPAKRTKILANPTKKVVKF